MLENNGFNKLVKTKNGYCLYNKNDIYIGKSIEKYGEFSEYETELFKQICKNSDIVIEVGSNIGTHTQVLSSLVGQKGVVIAFEPQRIVFQTLCANMAINSITNVYAYNEAVSNNEGYITVPDLDYNQNNNFGGISLNNSKKGFLVKTIVLDSFIDKINRLKFLKIDVEGMEKEVIEGSKKLIDKFKPIIYLENDRREKSEELINLLKSIDYKLYWHLPKLFNKNNYNKNSENVFGNIVSVNMLCIHKSLNIKIENMEEVVDSKFHPMKKENI